jgi:flagellar motor protein MotB
VRLTRQPVGSRREEENPYWISFSDLMSALLLVFILAVVVLVLQLTEKQHALAIEQETVQRQRDEFSSQVGTLQEAEQVRAQMLLEIEETLRRQGIEVIVSENNTVLSIPSALLGFDAQSYDIKDQYRPVSLAIGSTISDVISKDDRYEYLDTVFIEGHTDDRDFDGLEGTGNWGLSTFRAISLWRLWDETLPANKQLDELVSAEGAPLFSVSGYAHTRPVNAMQDTDQLRAGNRRIDVRFTIVRPNAEDLIEIEERLDEQSGS